RERPGVLRGPLAEVVDRQAVRGRPGEGAGVDHADQGAGDGEAGWRAGLEVHAASLARGPRRPPRLKNRADRPTQGRRRLLQKPAAPADGSGPLRLNRTPVGGPLRPRLERIWRTKAPSFGDGDPDRSAVVAGPITELERRIPRRLRVKGAWGAR